MRDKSSDKQLLVLGPIVGLICAAIGYGIFPNWWGGIGGFCVGAILAAAVANPGSKPPEVKDISVRDIKYSLENRLQQLKILHQRGLLTDEEYSSKKGQILQDL